MHSKSPQNNYTSNKYFLLALGLINILAFTLLFCAISLLMGFTIAKWQFPLAFITALIINFFAARYFISANAGSQFVRNSIVILLTVTGSILFAGYFYDISFDGQWYHQDTVYRLKQGYNPDYQQLAVPTNEILNSNIPEWCSGVDKPGFIKASVSAPINLKFININYFSKGAELMATSIYQVTNRLETGKAVNIVMLFASFFLCLSLLYKLGRITVFKKWLLSFLLAFNPVAIMQILTFCVDGCAACMLLSLLAIFGLFLINANRYYLILMAGLILMLVNIKFTALVFAAMFCIGFLVVLMLYKRSDIFKKVLLTGMISAVIGIFCCGFNPYVTNLVKQHNVFYGLDETRAEIGRLTPALFKDRNRFEKLFFSLTAHQGWKSADKHSLSDIPKIPFTFNKADIIAANDSEQELSGFGPFFSGELLITIVLLVIAVIQFRKEAVFRYTIAAILIILSTIIIIPDSWWARFVPQFWLIPVIIVGMGEFMKFRGDRIVRILIYLSALMNIAWSLLIIVFSLFITVHINYQLKQVKALAKPINIEYCNYRYFKSNQVRFLEDGIIIKQKNVTGPYIYNVIASNTRFETSEPLPDLPKPFLLKLSEKINGGK